MAFSELELEAIDASVGAMCRRRSPARFADKLRVVYEVEGHSISVFEERPDWCQPDVWRRMGVARFRYFRSRDEWTLYWMRRDLKWHVYDPETRKRDLATLVRVVDQDRYGAFFG